MKGPAIESKSFTVFAPVLEVHLLQAAVGKLKRHKCHWTVVLYSSSAHLPQALGEEKLVRALPPLRSELPSGNSKHLLQSLSPFGDLSSKHRNLVPGW